MVEVSDVRADARGRVRVAHRAERQQQHGLGPQPLGPAHDEAVVAEDGDDGDRGRRGDVARVGDAQLREVRVDAEPVCKTKYSGYGQSINGYEKKKIGPRLLEILEQRGSLGLKE